MTMISNIQSQKIHFAHISDIHLPPPANLPWSSFLNKRFWSRILWHYKRRHLHSPEIFYQILENILSHKELSGVLITGDQTNFGTEEEYLQIASWLKTMKLPSFVIPGNHDLMAPISPQKSLHHWQEWGGKNFPYVKIFHNIALIGVNSALPALPFMAYGAVRKKQREKLAQLLEFYGERNYCRILMIHHPPKAHLVSPAKSLLGSASFSSLLKKYGVEIILHGHSHNATSTTLEGSDIPLLGISSASMKSDLPYRVASWNHLIFSEEKHAWIIQNIRRNYQGDILEISTWQRNKNKICQI